MRSFPLLLIAVILYNIVAFGTGATHNDVYGTLNSAATIHMFSGDEWHYSIGDFLVTIGLVLLFIEIVKATRTSSRQILNHGLSMLTFVVALIEFITLRGFATSTFFLILAMCMIDVVGGYTISIIAAEHDLGIGRAGTD
ncbi:MAG: hypothetical protein JO056_07190 [Alphaproteobacteria bacterium]|jgi:hypothetical protein|nr:hypothetical protein [Alphaproteobacteria bacterium]